MEAKKPRFEDVPVDAIERPAVELRGHADEAGMKELRLSIKRHGVLVPLIVAESGHGYRLIAGLRRLCCAAANGLATVPAMIVASNDEWEAWATVAENALRESVNPVDEATYIAAVMERQSLSGSQAAAMFDRSESWVSQRLAILRWPDDVRDAVRQGWLSFAAGRQVAGISSTRARAFCLDTARRLGCTVRRAASWRQNWLKEQGRGDRISREELLEDPEQSFSSGSLCLFCERTVPQHEGMVVFACNECLAAVRDGMEGEVK